MVDNVDEIELEDDALQVAAGGASPDVVIVIRKPGSAESSAIS